MTVSRIAAGLLGLALLLERPGPVRARARGIVSDTCQACHGSGELPADGGASALPRLALTPAPTTFAPGELVTFTLTVRSSSARVAGAFITTGGVGTLRALPGEGLALDGVALTHAAPKAAVDGLVSFRFGWQAPSKPGGVSLHVAALAGNGNDASTGDVPGQGDFSFVFGCAARSFFPDLDRDGYGDERLGVRLGCSTDPAPTGYALLAGDCDENSEKVHPGAIEICNRYDDNCDGNIDEGSPPVVMWPDGDGDGYYRLETGTSKLGCGDVPGYAALGGDCDDANAAIHPRAHELCNLRDDDCDGDVDEGVRPRCGLGWCARYSLSCDPADCRPGPPATETCNAFDDDCDGEIDEGACTADGGDAGGSRGGAGGGAGGAGAAPNTGGASPPESGSPHDGCEVASDRGPWAELDRLAAAMVGLALFVRSWRRRR